MSKQIMKKFLENSMPEDPLDCMVELQDNERCDPTKIRDGSLLFRPSRLVVLNTEKSLVRIQELHENNQEHSDWNVSQDLIAIQCWTADQYTDVKKVSKPEMEEIVGDVRDCVCKVVFTKMPNANEMALFLREGSQLIESLETTEEEKVKYYKKLFECSQKGEYRIMRGYITKIEDNGMVQFLDADLEAKGEVSACRSFYMKNIAELTVRLVKYVVK